MIEKIQKTGQQQVTRAEKPDTYSVFSRLTGQQSGSSGEKPAAAKPRRAELGDRISLSLEAGEQARNQDISKKDGSLLDMDSFKSNLGMKPPGEKDEKAMPLARKLEILSMKTAGMGW